MTDPAANAWPDIPYTAWRETQATLHLWTQIVGKVRLARAPWVNHGWHATLYVSARGLTTGLVSAQPDSFELEFDLIDGRLLVRTTSGRTAAAALRPQSVSAFHAAVRAALVEAGLEIRFNGRPNEVADPVPFADDTRERVYDPEAARRFWLALVQIDRVFKLFRTRFIGKCSPVHFFWGSFDLAVTRFSGRTAPVHPGGVPNLPDRVTREAYSHEVSSAGFWPGGGPVDYPAFYSYAYPAPSGFSDAAIQPAEAFFHAGAGEFILPYDAVRQSASPDDILLAFLQSSYEAAAVRANWRHGDLEVPTGLVGRPRALERAVPS